jgi:hypothetical protein
MGLRLPRSGCYGTLKSMTIADLALLEALAFADDGIEENVIGASERVALLVEIFDAIDAAQELERRAWNCR